MGVQSPVFTGLYLSEKKRLARLIERITRDRHGAEDLIHDAFIRLFSTKHGQIADEQAYLAQVARNLAIDERRRMARAPVSDADLFEFADPAPSPEQIAVDREGLRIIASILGRFPVRSRRVFELHCLHGLTIAQISSEMGISTSNAGRLVLESYTVMREGLKRAGL